METKIKIKYNTRIIDLYLKAYNLSKKQFCQKCKISQYTLKKFYENNINVNIESIFKTCKILDLNIIFFFYTYSNKEKI